MPLKLKLPLIVIVFAVVPALIVGLSVSFMSQEAIGDATTLLISESQNAILELGTQITDYISQDMQENGGAFIVSSTQEIIDNMSQDLSNVGGSSVEKAAAQISALAESSINEITKSLIQEARTPLNDLISAINSDNERLALQNLQESTKFRAEVITEKLQAKQTLDELIPLGGGVVVLNSNGEIGSKYGIIPAEFDFKSSEGVTASKTFIWVTKQFDNGSVIVFAPTKAALGEVSKVQNNARRSLLLALSGLNKRAVELNSTITSQFQEPVIQLSAAVKEEIRERSTGITSRISDSLQSPVNEALASSVARFTPLAQEQALRQADIMEERSAGILASSQRKVISFAILILVLSILGAVTVSTFFVRGIVNRILRLLSMVDQVAKGNLSVKAKENTKDELGLLFKGFNQVTANLSVMVAKIKNTVLSCQEAVSTLNHVSDSSLQSAQGIKSAMSAVAVGACDSANQITKSVQEIGQIQHHSEEVGKSVGLAKDISGQVKSNTLDGRRSLSSLVDGLNNVSHHLNTLSGSVISITRKAEAIDDIVVIISSLAEQTKMVSLNASIEAAKAGVHGRSFSVVAEEVGKLAERVQEAGQQVSELVTDLQNSFSELRGVVEQSRDKSATGQASIQEAESAFNRIEISVSDISAQVDAIHVKTAMLMDNAHQATDFINDVATITEEMSASAQEVTASTEEQVNNTQGLSEVAENLERLIASLDDGVKQFQV